MFTKRQRKLRVKIAQETRDKIVANFIKEFIHYNRYVMRRKRELENDGGNGGVLSSTKN